MSSLQGRVVVVTGASAGVGRATSRRFAREGADVALLARGVDGLHATRNDVEALGRRALVLPADVSDAAAVDEAAARVERELGPIDIWVNNAMVSVFSPIREMTAAEFRRVTEVTYLGCVYGTLAALRYMLPRRRGRIIQVGSALAYRGIPLQAAYCASKHAIQGFTDSLRCELLHDHAGVSVCMVQLPAMNTPQFEWSKTRLPGAPQPVPPIFEPEVAAEAIVAAARSTRRELMVGAPTVLAIAGNKLLPGLADRYLARTAYRSQQLDYPPVPDRPDNLWKPVAGDYGARGPFGDRSRTWSPQLWATLHRRAVGAAVMALGALLVVAAVAPRVEARRPAR